MELFFSWKYKAISRRWHSLHLWAVHSNGTEETRPNHVHRWSNFFSSNFVALTSQTAYILSTIDRTTQPGYLFSLIDGKYIKRPVNTRYFQSSSIDSPIQLIPFSVYIITLLHHQTCNSQ